MTLRDRKSALSVVVVLLCVLPLTAGAGAVHLRYKTASGALQIKTWKDIRDAGVVKQGLDDSCGAAAAATILKSFYGQPVSEGDILEELRQVGTIGAASFASLEQVMKGLGYKAASVSLSFNRLRDRLRVPAIALLRSQRNFGNGHFAVIRGIGPDGRVRLADPSWGNRTLPAHRFRPTWEMPDTGRGKLLLVLPRAGAPQQMDWGFLTVPRPNRLAVDRLANPIQRLSPPDAP